MLCAVLSLLMNVTCVPRVTRMFFGLTVLPEMVIVCVVTASAGVVVGLLGPLDEELEPLPQAATAKAAAAAKAAASVIRRVVVIRMRVLDLNPA